MVLDEPVTTFLSRTPDAGSPDDPIADRRATILAASDELFRAFGQPAPDVASITEHVIAQPSGAIRVRVYRPVDDRTPLPVHVFIHGGGFWLGSVDELVVDATCRERSRFARCVVVAVDYRLAPEHPFPGPVEDCYAALLWTRDRATSFGGNPDRMTIGGVSAGANLAAAVALAARDRGGPALSLQLLEVPTLDLTLDAMRASGVGNDFGISVADMASAVGLYLSSADDATHPYASPLLAPDLTGLPAAVIMTAEFDPLRHEGELYAQRLTVAGVDVVHRRYPRAVHGSLALTGSWEPARSWRADLLAALRDAHHPSG